MTTRGLSPLPILAECGFGLDNSKKLFCSNAQMPRSVKTALAVLTDRARKNLKFPVDGNPEVLIYYAPEAPVVKLAYTPDSGSGAARCVGSNPTGCTKKAGPFVYRLGHLVLIQVRAVRLR